MSDDEADIEMDTKTDIEMTMKMNLKSKMSMKGDERGVYGIFFVILVTVLLISVGLAIDGPRQITTHERSHEVAEEAARYALGLISTGVPFAEVQIQTERFVAIQDPGTYGSTGLELVPPIECDVINGEVSVEVRAGTLNTLSALIFGRERTFTAVETAGLSLVTSGGEVRTINPCDPTPLTPAETG